MKLDLKVIPRFPRKLFKVSVVPSIRALPEVSLLESHRTKPRPPAMSALDRMEGWEQINGAELYKVGHHWLHGLEYSRAIWD